MLSTKAWLNQLITFQVVMMCNCIRSLRQNTKKKQFSLSRNLYNCCFRNIKTSGLLIIWAKPRTENITEKHFLLDRWTSVHTNMCIYMYYVKNIIHVPACSCWRFHCTQSECILIQVGLVWPMAHLMLDLVSNC